MTTDERANLWDSAYTGNYPSNTTAHDLAQCWHDEHLSALHFAALNKHLPCGTTKEDMLQCSNQNGYTVLHIAAATNQLPQNTTLHDLIGCKDKTGTTPLHTGAAKGFLHPDTTTELLKATKNNANCSAWDRLREFLTHCPTKVFQLPSTLFKDDTQFAIDISQQAVKKNSRLAAESMIWLGHVLAAATRNGDKLKTVTNQP